MIGTTMIAATSTRERARWASSLSSVRVKVPTAALWVLRIRRAIVGEMVRFMQIRRGRNVRLLLIVPTTAHNATATPTVMPIVLSSTARGLVGLPTTTIILLVQLHSTQTTELHRQTRHLQGPSWIHFKMHSQGSQHNQCSRTIVAAKMNELLARINSRFSFVNLVEFPPPRRQIRRNFNRHTLSTQ